MPWGRVERTPPPPNALMSLIRGLFGLHLFATIVSTILWVIELLSALVTGVMDLPAS